jgi:hypothetical protein
MSQFNHFLTFENREGFVALNAKSEAEALNLARMIAEQAAP